MRVSDTLEKRQHSVLRIDNRMTAFGLKDLTSREQNIWWTIVKLIYNKGTDELTLLRSEIESISGYKSLKERDSNGNYVDKFIYEMKVLGKKLLSLNTEIIDNETNECVLFTIFPVFKVDSNCIHIRVSEYFSPWFNDLKLNYTRLDLTVMLGLKSNYAKNLYRYLIRWQNYKTDDTDFPGCWIVDVDRFRNLMDIPKTYNNNDIFRRVIEPSLKELEKKDEKIYRCAIFVNSFNSSLATSPRFSMNLFGIDIEWKSFLNLSKCLTKLLNVTPSSFVITEIRVARKFMSVQRLYLVFFDTVFLYRSPISFLAFTRTPK